LTLVIIFGPPAVGKMTVGLHLKIDNTTLEPGVVAGQIVAYFSLS